MKDWDGRYENTYEGKQSLEDDIRDAGIGKICYPTDSGGIVNSLERNFLRFRRNDYYSICLDYYNSSNIVKN